MSKQNHIDIEEYCRGCEVVSQCIEARRKLGITDQAFIDILRSVTVEIIPGQPAVPHQKKCSIIKKMAENKPDILPPPKKKDDETDEETPKATDEEIKNFEDNYMQ